MYVQKWMTEVMISLDHMVTCGRYRIASYFRGFLGDHDHLCTKCTLDNHVNFNHEYAFKTYLLAVLGDSLVIPCKGTWVRWVGEGEGVEWGTGGRVEGVEQGEGERGLGLLLWRLVRLLGCVDGLMIMYIVMCKRDEHRIQTLYMYIL